MCWHKDPILERVCRRCEIAKPQAEYNGRTCPRTGIVYTKRLCMECEGKRNKKYQDGHSYVEWKREWSRRNASRPHMKFRKFTRKLVRDYKLERAEYDAMLVKSCGHCDICDAQFLKREPFLDHCHKTRKVRGLLCSTCNSMLGLARDSVEILDSAKAYLSCK